MFIRNAAFNGVKLRARCRLGAFQSGICAGSSDFIVYRISWWLDAYKVSPLEQECLLNVNCQLDGAISTMCFR